MRKRRYVRIVVAGAVLVLLAGCGEGSGGKTSALSEQQMTTVVPDAKAVPGWEVLSGPAADTVEGDLRGSLCPQKEKHACEGARFVGTSRFKKEKKAEIGFWAITYRDEKAAEDAFDVHWDWYRKSLRKPESLDLGRVGEQRQAALGTGNYQGAKRAVAQVRLGTVIMWVSLDASQQTGIDAALVKDLAAVLATRADEAPNGKTPVAALDS
ncbi:hypothetical protein [Streptomyces sp. V1I1]|uniref:hypothetical protein n=1 Tax=Streptomyces sp. V1I1 TaxID=3042272 RepID=UPI002780C89B|nr:hypothetical protein [Streptomyces sp. V1I1]MDQ0940336.1 hypothetical protein [Streptomyces sp. V1I1]